MKEEVPTLETVLVPASATPRRWTSRSRRMAFERFLALAR
jgi:hypothetical protein